MSAKSKAEIDYTGREFTFTRELAAPRELVWRACTEAGHVAQWWGPKGFTAPVCEWDARPGQKIYVLMRAPNGMDFPMGGEFREVVPPERLVTVTGALDEKGKPLFQILHTLTLAEHNGKTTLTMHSRVLSVTPGAARYLGGFELGMTLSLDRLGTHLGQQTEPLVVERTYRAPVALVWRALTNKSAMKRWSFDLKEFRAEKGFRFEFTVEHNGTTYRHLCCVTEVVPQKRLAYTWRYHGRAGNSLVSFDLVAEGQKTRVKLTHLGLESFPARPEYARNNFVEGWTAIVGTNLKRFVEAKAKKPTKIHE